MSELRRAEVVSNDTDVVAEHVWEVTDVPIVVSKDTDVRSAIVSKDTDILRAVIVSKDTDVPIVFVSKDTDVRSVVDASTKRVPGYDTKLVWNSVMSTFEAPSKRKDAGNEDVVICAMMRFKLVYFGRSASRQR